MARPEVTHEKPQENGLHENGDVEKKSTRTKVVVVGLGMVGIAFM